MRFFSFQTRQRGAQIVLLLIPAGIGVATLLLWQALRMQEQADTLRGLDSAAAHIRDEISEKIHADTRALSRMGKRWIVSGPTPRAYWEADAHAYIHDTPDYQAIEWIDPSLHIRWLVPLAGNESALNLNLVGDRRRATALLNARDQKRTTVSRPITLVQGGAGFLVYIPLYRHQHFEGLIAGVFRFSKLLNALPADMTTGWTLAIREDGKEIYRRGNGGQTRWARDAVVNLDGPTWTLRLIPEASTLAKYRSPLPSVVLVIGALMMLMTGCLLLAIRRAQAAQERLMAEAARRVESEEELRRAHERAQTILESITDAFLTFDRDWRFVSLNQEAERIMRRSREELIGKNVWEEYPHAVGTDWQANYLRAVTENTAVAFEVYTPHSGRWSDVRAYPSSEGLTVYFRDITERKRAEITLQKSQQSLKQAQALAHIGSWELDLRTRRGTWSEEMFRIYGREPACEPPPFAEFLSAVHPEDRENVRLHSTGCVGGELEFRLLLADGALRHVYALSEVVADANGAPILLRGTLMDVTERKRAEDTFRRSEEFLRRMIASSGDCIKVLDLEARLVSMNEGGQCLMEVENFALLCGADWPAFWQGEARETALAAVEAARSGEAGRFQGFCPTAKGTPKWWDVVVTPILGADGKPEQLLSVSRDITQQKRSEEALRESQRFIESIAEATPNILYLYDLTEQRNIYANREVGTTLGYTIAEIQQMGSALLPTLMYPDDLPVVLAHFAEFGSASDGEVREVEYRMRHASGEWHWFRSRDTIYMRDASGTPCQIVGIAEDVTERKWFEEQIEQQIMRVNEANVELNLQQMELAEANARLETLATTDGLTGLKNHRAFQERAAAEFERSRRYGTYFALLLLDVDHFKQFNDTFGHPAGDQVLKQVAATLQSTVRVTDMAARYGGEEFAIILPETDTQGATELAERLRAAIASHNWEQRQITVSIGVTVLKPATESFAALLQEADEALYESKTGGRNRATLYSRLPQELPSV